GFTRVELLRGGRVEPEAAERLEAVRAVETGRVDACARLFVRRPHGLARVHRLTVDGLDRSAAHEREECKHGECVKPRERDADAVTTPRARRGDLVVEGAMLRELRLVVERMAV